MRRNNSLNILSFFIFIHLILLLNTSCKKKTITYDFEGKITNVLNGNPIEGAKIEIFQKEIVNGTESNKFNLVAETNTDANGDFSLQFNRSKVTEFNIKISKSDYFKFEEIRSSAEVTTGEVNLLNQSLTPIATVIFDISNNFPDESDEFKLVTQTFKEGCENCAENQTRTFTGALDTNLVFETDPNMYAKFTYINVTSENSKTDSIYTQPFETVTYSIVY